MLQAQGKFDTNIDVLLNGDIGMNIIGGEKRPKTVKQLNEIRAMWAPVSEAVTQMANDPKESAAADVTKESSLVLFEETDTLVAEISAECSNPAELLQVDAMMLEIVGRQPMPTQKIAKNACKIKPDSQRDASIASLSDAMGLFEVSLDALIAGMPSVGLPPAPTPEIEAGIQAVLVDWSETRPLVDQLFEVGALGSDEQIALLRRMNDKIYRLEGITHDYALFSRHTHKYAIFSKH